MFHSQKSEEDTVMDITIRIDKERKFVMTKAKRLGWFLLYCLINCIIPMVPFYIGCEIKNDGNFILSLIIIGVSYLLMELRQYIKTKNKF